MPKGSSKLVKERREEIMNACEMLYQTMGFKDITLKEIGKVTSFTRTSIYNYFKSKEEIFLAILEREYISWIEDLKEMMNTTPQMSKEEFARAFSHTVEKRDLLLKIIAMNHYDMESGSSEENLTHFKEIYGQALQTVSLCLEFYFPNMSINHIQDFIYVFFPFMFGIYPYTIVNERQKKAMEEANVHYVFMSIYEITYNCVSRLLDVN